MYAVIQTGGKQYKIAPDARLRVEKLDAEIGDEVEFSNVLLVSKDGAVTLGQPFVKGAVVKAKVLRQKRAKKIIVFKFKRRKGYKKKQGHRQYYTEIQISNIETN